MTYQDAGLAVGAVVLAIITLAVAISFWKSNHK